MKSGNYIFSLLVFLLLNYPLQMFSERYFVTVNGAGQKSGDSWENAFSNDELIMLFDGFLEDGDSVFVAQGTYTTKGSQANGNPASMLYCNVAANIYGGYPTSMTGTDININYPTTTETVFSGDLSGSGVTNASCSSNFLYYYTENAEVDIKGITFAYCYHAGVNNLTGYNFDNIMTDNNGYGALVLEQTNATVQWCKFYKNATPKPTNSSDGSMYYGGALNIQGCELIHVVDCIFEDNFAARCGAAIGIKSPATGGISSTVVVERCLFDRNSLATEFNGKYGGSININSVGNCYIINSTFARAKYFANGGAISTGNINGKYYIISSTFAENDDYYYYTPGTTTGGSYGKNIRGSNGSFYMANSINVNNRVDKYFVFTNDTYNKVCAMYNENFTSGDQIQYNGYNLLGITGTIKADTTATYASTDIKEKYYEDIFNKTYDINNIASTSLAENGGFSMTMKPVTNYIGMPQTELSNLKTLWSIPGQIWDVIDLSVDQRGYTRSATLTSVGAYDVNGVGYSAVSKTEAHGEMPGIRYLENSKYLVTNITNSKVSVLNVNGLVLQTKNNVNDNDVIDLSGLPNGIYFIVTNNNAIKIIK